MAENLKKNRTIDPVKKILSTTATYISQAQPQWTSDTRINYISNNDFITYDIEEDELDLIERIDNERLENLKSVKFMNLIGQHPVRIIYAYLNSETKIWNLAIIPSYDFGEEYEVKPININNKGAFSHLGNRIVEIGDVVTLSDIQSAMIPITLQDNRSYILLMKLNSNTKSLLFLNQNIENQEQPQKIIKILQTKVHNIMIILTTTKLILVKLVLALDCLQEITSIQLDHPIQRLESSDVLTLFLSKIYLFYRVDETIYGYFIDEEKVCGIQKIYQPGLHGITGGGNKIIYWLNDSPLLYQYKIDDKNSEVEHLNTIKMQNANISKILNVVVSQNARHALILANIALSEQTQAKNQPGVQFILFKLQLYTELRIPQSSIYMQNLKYISRKKKVSKMCIPRINEKLYALTGAEVHTLSMHRMMGVMTFDIHPYGFYMIISYMFNIKIYSLQPSSNTLLYSFSMHNVKRVEYSPDGSIIVLFSPRKIKLVDAYSFDLKEQFQEKNNNIIDICFGAKKKNLFILLDNGTIINRNFLVSEVLGTYHVFGQTNHKFIMFKIEEKHSTLFFLLDNGTILVKKLRDLTANEEIYEYDDGQIITQFLIQTKNNLIIVGTRSGKVRFHINDPIDGCINFRKYCEKWIGIGEISSLVTPVSQNMVYVGSSNGDITILKYSLETIKMKTGYYKQYQKILDIPHIPNNNSKIIEYFTFDFELVSLAKLQGDSQQNSLEDKYEGLIDKIKQYGSQYKNQIQKEFIELSEKYKQKNPQQNMHLYRQQQSKMNKLKSEVKNHRIKYNKLKDQMTEEFMNRMRKIYEERQELQKQKKEKIQNLKEEKYRNQNQIGSQLFTMMTEIDGKHQEMKIFMKKEKFENEMNGDFDDFQVSETDALKFYAQNLDKEFKKTKDKERELNKNNGYLETAVKNMQARKSQEEALLHRIDLELQMLSNVKQQQNGRINHLQQQLKSTEDTIHKIQNKVKNTPNNVISSDKADNDLCSYKIWMKDKVGEEVEQLGEYLQKIEVIFDKKSQEMVAITAEKNKAIEKIKVLEIKKEEYKKKMAYIKGKLVTSHFHEQNLIKSLSPDMLKQNPQKSSNQYQQKKANKIVSYERIYDKATHFENKNIKNYKRKVKNLGSNKGELLVEYEQLKYFNKSLVDKQRKYLGEIKITKNQLNAQKTKNKHGVASQRVSVNHSRSQQTPFLKYIRHKKMKSSRNITSLLQTAVSTPRNLYTPVYKIDKNNKKY